MAQVQELGYTRAGKRQKTQIPTKKYSIRERLIMVAKKKTAKVKSGPGRELLPLTIKKFIDDYIYRIDLDADYQREKIWSRDEQLKLMDSIIKNIDIPKMYLAKVAGNENFDFECIDGKQRMSTLLS